LHGPADDFHVLLAELETDGKARQGHLLTRLHARIARVRRDFLHKLTTRLCRENQTVVIEDLNVRGMLANAHLSRAIADIGFYEFRRQLQYKAMRYGTPDVSGPLVPIQQTVFGLWHP
jgi:IS605 OrfB family transposase